MLPLILLSLLTLASSKASAVQITGEYWISPSTNGQHLGTLQDPFDGSTTANFDSTIQSLPAGSSIHVLPGTYDTLGNYAWTLKSGQKLLGSGMGVTILRAAQGTNHGGLIVVSSSQYVANTNIEVSDLTVDCNYPTNLQSSTYGCIIGGTHCAIRREA